MTGASAATVTRAGVNPFVGPRPIDIGQKIFGRDREIDKLYYLLSAERIVLFHSPSGAGKSSLIQAGLVKRLEELFDVWGPTRVNLPLPEGESAGVNRYVRSANLGFEARIPKERQRLPEVLSPHTLSEYVAGRPRRRSAPKNVVLIFDQFEEILTVDPPALEAKREFFDQVGRLLQDPHVWALFAMREDYMAPLDPYAEQVPTHLKNRFRLDLLGRDAAREAISRSVEEGGRDIARNAVERLVNDLATMLVQRPDGTFESQTGPYVEPLQLQVACRGLWERLPEDRRTIDLDDIESFGDVTKALAEYYEREVAGIAGGDARVERALREWVGGKLITPDGIRGQVLKGAGESEGLENELIGRLVDTHLVRGEQRAGATWYELSHDRLIEPVRKNNAAWLKANLSMLQREAALWDKQNRPNGLLLRGEALVEAERWATEHADALTPVETDFLAASRDARKQAKRLRWMRIATVCGFVLAAVVFSWAVAEHFRSDKRNAQTKEDAEQYAKNTKRDADAKVKAANDASSVITQQAKKDQDTATRELTAADAKEEQLSRAAEYARAVGLAVQSEKSSTIDKLPEQSLLLALEAIRKIGPANPQIRTPENALREALAHSGGLVFGGREKLGNDIAIRPDGHWLATVTSDGKEPGHLWDIRTNELVPNPIALEMALAPMKISLNGRWLVARSNDGGVRLWDLNKQPVGSPISLHSGKITQFQCVADISPTSACVSADSHWLITPATGPSVDVWDLRTGDPATENHKQLEGEFRAVSSDGRWLVTTSGTPCKNPKNYLWDLTSNDLDAGRRNLNTPSVGFASFSADNELLVTAGGCYDDPKVESILAWRLKEPELISIPLGGKDSTKPITGLAISPDHMRVIVQTAESEYLWGTAASDKPQESPQVLSHPGTVIEDSFFSSNGHWLFGFGKESSFDYKVWMWNVSSRDPAGTIRALRDPSTSEDILSTDKPFVSEDMSWIFLFSGPNAIVLDLAQKNPGDNPHVLVGHDKGQRIRSGDVKPEVAVTQSVPDGTIRVWDLKTSRQIANPIMLDGLVSPDGRWLAAVSASNNALRLWDLDFPANAPQVLPGIEKGDSQQPPRFNFSDNSHWLQVVQGTGARLWNLPSAHPGGNPVPLELGTIHGPGTFSPDGRWLVALSASNNAVRLWDLDFPANAPQVLPGTEKADSQKQPRFNFSGNSHWLQVAQGNVARLWNLAAAHSGGNPVPLELGPVNGVSIISPDGSWVAALDNGNTVRLWDLSSPAAVSQVLPGNEKSDTKTRRRFNFSHNGHWLWVAQGNVARLWNLASSHSGGIPVPLELIPINGLPTISPDGSWVAALSDNGSTVKLWDLSSPAAVTQVVPGLEKGDSQQQPSLRFSGDSQWLEVTQNNVAQLLNLGSARSGAKRSPLQLGTANSPGTFSPDGHWLLVDDHLWDLTVKNYPSSIAVPDFNTRGLVFFSKDSRWLAANSPQYFSLWKLGTRGEDAISKPIDLPTFGSTDRGVHDVNFSADEGWIVGTTDAGALIWKARLKEDLIPLACRTAGRNLSAEEWKHYFEDEPYHQTCPDFPPGDGVPLSPHTPTRLPITGAQSKVH